MGGLVILYCSFFFFLNFNFQLTKYEIQDYNLDEILTPRTMSRSSITHEHLERSYPSES